MTLKSNTALLTAVILTASMCGCSDIKQTSPYLDMQMAEFNSPLVTETTSSTTAVSTTTVTTTETTITGPSYTQASLSVPPMYIQETYLEYQAEDAELTAAFQAYNSKPDYTGSGYVSGLQGILENTFIFKTEVPSSQHYDITVIVCAEEGAEFSILHNGEEIETIAIEANDRFVSVTVPGIFMEMGSNDVGLKQLDGNMLIDCLELRNNTSLSPHKDISCTPCNPDASPKTSQLLSLLCSVYGKGMLSGQHVSSSENEEIVRIIETTGKSPAVRFGDMYFSSANGGDPVNTDTVNGCLKWSEKGGITGLMWHWYAPSGQECTLAPSEEFSLSDAIPSEDIALCSEQQIQVMEKASAVSAECAALTADIDAVAQQLKLLANKDVPVLWRPLHQAGSGNYWWESEGSDVYLWLWQFMYRRMTEYHGLNNLLWVWSGVDSAYLPDSSMYDIVSADIYTESSENFGSGYQSFYALQIMTEGKLVALSECSSIPDISIAFRDGCVWSYFGLWYEPYIDETDTEHVTSEQLISVYNSDAVITLDELEQLYSELTVG